MSCAESLRVQAYFDGELKSGEAGDVEEHLTQCVPCQGLLEELERTRTTLRRSLAGERASPALRARVMRALDAEESPPARARRPRAWHVRPFWIGALSGASGLAVAAAGAFLLFTAVSSNAVLEAVTDAHVRSLSSRHLIDVVSSDRHTVKPWFAGRTDVSPPVADFAAQGYRLLGGRTENLGHERAAVLVYQHGAHLINVFSWSARTPLPAQAVRSGYHMVLWKSGDIESCAVSDAGWDELNALVGLIKGVSANDTPH
ncbi:MAG TPA: anti-sigma factor [Steroidobacteraceae bacterium]|nr:anti-sigma factor [Steroidobacteraceae bacterium]